MAIERHPVAMSYADALLLPPESPGEILAGVLTVVPAPTPRHQRIAGYIARVIGNYLEAHPEVGDVYTAPIDVVLRAERPAIVVQPDVVFIAASRRSIVTNAVHGAPDLVVEVVSPSTKRTDAVLKRAWYATYGVAEYWLVWPDEAHIDVMSRLANDDYGAPQTLTVGEVLASPLLPGLALDVRKVFGLPEAGT